MSAPNGHGYESEVRALYRRLLDGWNQRHAEAMAEPFAEEGELIGFDGSEVIGKHEIVSHLQGIFAHHQPPSYVAKIRSVRRLGPEAALLRAIAGMVPPGQADLNPNLNAHHTVVAVKREGRWQIAFFQNTPAQFHGRPDLVKKFTEELRQSL